MNLNIKKIALIIAAGVFALSTAFGAEKSLDIKKIRIINDAPNYKVNLMVKTEDSEIDVGSRKEIDINKPITDIKLNVEKIGETESSGTKTVRANIEKKSVDIKVKERNLTTAQALEAAFEESILPVKVTAKVEGKTLKITIKEPKINIFLQ